VTAIEGDVLDVGPTGLTHPEAVQVPVGRRVPHGPGRIARGEQERAELQAIQPPTL